MIKPQTKLPGIGRAIFFGMILGLIVQLTISWCYAPYFIFVEAPVSFHTPTAWTDLANSFTRGDIGIIFVAVISIIPFGFYIAIFTIVPTTIAGGFIGATLYSLANRNALDNRAIALVGAFAGFWTGWITASYFFPPASISYEIYVPQGDPLPIGLLFACGGVLHSFVMSRWLRKRMGNPP